MLALNHKKHLIMTRFILWLFVCSLFVISCTSSDSDIAQPATDTGTGGSLARFTIVGNYLYTLDQSRLTAVDISNPEAPKKTEVVEVGNGAETIFPLNDYLLLGTRTGMLIYRIGDNGRPDFVSSYEHIISCDPVVANEQYAYVTLRAAGCRGAGIGARDLLDVIDISDTERPKMVASYDMDSPYGLGLDGVVLFVCEGSNGLKVFSLAEDPTFPQLITTFANIDARDVIPLDGTLLVVGPEKLMQLDYRDLNNLKIISEISIGA